MYPPAVARRPSRKGISVGHSPPVIRLTVDLSDSDLAHLTEVAQRTCALAAQRSDVAVIDAARELLIRAEQTHAPPFVRQKFAVLEQLLASLDDREWALVESDRKRVVNALACLSETPSAETGSSGAIAALDYAIIIELIARDLQHDLAAYEAFCRFRESINKSPPRATSRPITHAERLGAKRSQLQERMHTRRRRDLDAAQPAWRKLFAVFGF